MQPIDAFSYQCGVMDCFCEMVAAGVKRFALSHPMDTRQERDALLEYASSLCAQYAIFYYAEENGLVTDLFPASMSAGKYNILFFGNEEALEEYLALKAEKLVFSSVGQYTVQERRALALRYAKLLGYSEQAALSMIERNPEKEP